jgi:UDP-N-acetylmuramoylalanine--D-glutamate ligase
VKAAPPRRALILGLAREGVSLARFLAERGSDVTVTDAAPLEKLTSRIRSLAALPVRVAAGGHKPELVAEADEFFVSPGVPESNPVYEAAREAGLPVQSMTTLFFDLCPGKIIGVTGSSGKTTTTGLIGHILREAGRDVVVGGNIGDPMLDLLPQIEARTLVVLELSSFQLELLRTSPHIAVVTNITPNHLDRHGTMDAYVAAKRHILEHQAEPDFAVLNADDSELQRLSASTPATKRWFSSTSRGLDVGICADRLGVWRPSPGGGDAAFEEVIEVEKVSLLGAHNLANVAAAMAVADILGVSAEVMRGAIQTYAPPPHRLQIVGEYQGVTYIDDSIATTPARVIVALQALSQPILLIAGGRDKKLPWSDFAHWTASLARALILIGEAAPLIEQAVRAVLKESSLLRNDMIFRCESMESAVATAGGLAGPGDVVLLSPGCTSYDMFTDFHERACAFAAAVEDLHAA